MLDHDMKEAKTGEVDILDVDPDTLKQMLEFIYTGQVQWAIGHSPVLKILNAFFLQQVEDENYTAELLYAADKYELDKLVIL